MRAPFPVEFTCTPGLAWRTALAALVAAALAVPLAWALAWGVARGALASAADGFAPGAVQATIAIAIAIVVVAALAFVRCARSRTLGTRARTLRWDGEDWILPAAGPGAVDQRGAAALMLDLGPWMLVRFRPHLAARRGDATWLPLHAAGDFARWAALRTALWTWRGPTP